MTTQSIQQTAQIAKTVSRPPIVVILGHVDHGKSSLLEAIREDFKITSRESGGITQHIGAYEVEHKGKKITFLDTPGHEAFFAMRSRGAKVADIAVLVIAADEGVKPQTKESIQQAKMAGIPLIVAVNKIDKPGANAERVKKQLAENEIFVESFGGNVPVVETSAITKQGISDLLEMILLIADIQNLGANREKPGEGVVIEAYLDHKRGPAATLLVRDGTLKQGDIVATKSCSGKIRIMEDFQGSNIDQSFPSMPAVVLGLEICPRVGEEFRVFLTEQEAGAYALQGHLTQRILPVVDAEPGKKIWMIILKADVLGSLEALENVLSSLPQDKGIVRILSRDIGEISENDIELAETAGAHIFGFRVKPNPRAAALAERKKISARTFDIIYDLVQEVRKLQESLEELEGGRKDIGSLKVLAVFLKEKNRQIVGGTVIEGEVKRGSSVELSRGKEIIGKGKVINLQKNKKDVAQVSQGSECGILYEGAAEVQRGDTLKFFI